jgi:O-antigen/teichoic acid export membrane protein
LTSNKYIFFAFLLAFVSLISSGLGYVYQVLVGNYFGPVEYAEISFVVASSVILSTPFGGLLMKFTRDLSSLPGDKKKLFLGQYFQLFRSALFYAPIVFVLSIALLMYSHVGTISKVLSQAFFITNLSIVLIFLQINSAVYVARKDFKNQSLYQIKLNVLKILLFLLSIYLAKTSVSMCFIMLILSYFLVFIFDYRKLQQFAEPDDYQKSKFKHLLRYENLHSITIANIIIIALMQLDVIFVNLIFTKELAGNFAAASLLGKSIYIISVALSDSHFSLYSENPASSTKASLYKSLVYVFFTSVICIIFFFLFSQKIIHVFFGNKYTYASDILKYYSFFILPVGLTIVLQNYFVAQKIYVYTWILLCLLILACIFIFFFHDQVFAIPLAFGFSSLIFLVISIFSLSKK